MQEVTDSVMTIEEFKDVGEVEVDSRKRVSIGRVGTVHNRYMVQVAADGEIRLTPLVSIPAREVVSWKSPAVREPLERGLKEAEEGLTIDRGSFAQYLDDDEDE